LLEVLEALLVEVEGQLAPPKNARSGSGRRWTGKTPNSQKGVSGLKLAKECLGDYPKEASLSLVGQERKIWATLEAFDWPEE
jgi:hypothetical protein